MDENIILLDASHHYLPKTTVSLPMVHGKRKRHWPELFPFGIWKVPVQCLAQSPSPT
jgi:hypothetical protein